MKGQSRVQTETILTRSREMKESGQGQTSAVEGEGRRAAGCGGGLLSAIQFKNKAAKINKDVVTERRALAAAVKNAQDRTLKK